MNVPMKRRTFLLGAATPSAAVLAARRFCAPGLAQDAVPPPGKGGPRIKWDDATLVRVQGGTYGRMMRLRSGAILCCYEAGGQAWTSRSGDNGKTWGEPVLARAIEGAGAANPEMVQLPSGRVLLFYNQRPRSPQLPFAIGMCRSDDNGATWQAEGKLIYEAGHEPQAGCWEPAALLLPSGEVQLFFANEAPFPSSDDQEITLMRSRDGGSTWSAPQRVAYRPGHRDGMPVPILLRNWTHIALAIEDNGLAPGNSLQPAIISTPLGASWKGSVGASSPRRWGAIVPALPGNVYAGAPYLRQMPGGETILSCQSNQGGRQQPQMVVYVGDREARNFRNPSAPFKLSGNVGGSWNSLFVKDSRTITALSDTAINGVRGLWAIDGRLMRGE